MAGLALVLPGDRPVPLPRVAVRTRSARRYRGRLRARTAVGRLAGARRCAHARGRQGRRRRSSSRRSSISSAGATSPPRTRPSTKSTWLGMKQRGHQRPAREEPRTKDPDDLPTWDRKVYDVDRVVLPDAGELVSNFGNELKARAKIFYTDFEGWQEKVADEVRERKWIDKRGRCLWVGAIAIFFALFVIGFAIGMFEARTPGTVPVAGIGDRVAGRRRTRSSCCCSDSIDAAALTRRSGKGAELARELGRHAPLPRGLLGDEGRAAGVRRAVGAAARLRHRRSASRTRCCRRRRSPRRVELASRAACTGWTATALGGGLTSLLPE